eukprot:COSAG04_NODE_22800_length_349_cov_0.504000_1_plen_63_part_10
MLCSVVMYIDVTAARPLTPNGTVAAREPSSTVLGLAKLRLRVGVFSFAFEEAFGGATDPRVSG